jgi:hypothetical protein
MDEARSAHWDLRHARDAAIEAATRAAVEEATARVHAEFASRLEAADAEIESCRLHLIKVTDAGPDHEWTGKRVKRQTTKYRAGRDYEVTLEGVVEMCRSNGDFCGRSWRGALGKPIVRLINSGSGKLGKTTQEFSSAWKLVEG